ncbi:MAG: ATP-binding protein [Lachnospiraceae bacterium]|nr:ATP-binding protein [Lachnospiraceae bacterium]
MERSITEQLIKWKDSKERKPLILEGARQVGKTWIVKEFGRSCFSGVAYVNFDREKALKEILARTVSPEALIPAISVLLDMSIDPENTLIIFDEVQEEPRALSCLKYFCEEAPEYHIVATGSFMGIALHQGTSFPVGKVDMMKMYPLSFLEFLEAVGKKQLRTAIENNDRNMVEPFRNVLTDFLRTYYVVGGMPEAVQNYIDHKDLLKVREKQESILDLYRQDFSKHAPVSLIPRLNQVWDAVPNQLSKENRKFIYGQVSKGARAKDFELAIMWLSDCGLIHLVHRVSKPGLPLKAYEEMSAFKIYLNDVGLLGAMGQISPKAVLEGNKLFTEFKGAMTEQYVLQQMVGGMGIKPYYYSAENSRGEIDFLLQGADTLIPVEVKSEENLQAKSLRAFYDKYGYKGVRISMSDYREQEWLTNYPLYAFMSWLNVDHGV